MNIHIETERLIIRAINENDVEGIYLLDSDPEVHTYLGNKPIKTRAEAEKTIQFIKKQYAENGIGRWAVVEKKSNTFIGWTGLKWITEPINGKSEYYDLGYRFIKKYWGKGYATESAIASLDFAFNELKQDTIDAMADMNNIASNKILQKIGMSKIGELEYDEVPHHHYRITKEDWEKR